MTRAGRLRWENRPYGERGTPGSPGSWDREVWWALNRAARIGRPTGRNRWRLAPPFRLHGLLVTAGRPNLPWSRSTATQGHLTHGAHSILFAWRAGELAGRMVAWQCGARSAHFRLLNEPDSPVCQMCLFHARGRQVQ